MLQIIIGILLSYCIGSIPTAYIFGKVTKGIDIRNFGSGNVGATNAVRVLGKPLGICVLLCDICKGVVAVNLIGRAFTIPNGLISQEMQYICYAIACIVGHNWTVFLHFKGGKGVATSLGVILGLAMIMPTLWMVLVCVFLFWLVIFLVTRTVSLASMSAAIVFPLSVVLLGGTSELILFSLILCIFIFVRHTSNIKRLIQGKENKL